jgi:hypothetical protein
VAHHFTFFGQFGGVTRQCALCSELLVVNAASQDLDSLDANRLWSTAFARHIEERHSTESLRQDFERCSTRM